jgi:hypothetical protein
MKKILMIVAFLFVTCFTFAQTDDGRSMKPVMESMYTVVNTAEGNGLEIVRIEFDIVKKDVPKESYRILTDAYTYRVGVFGDWRTEDMDIEIWKQQSDGTYVFVEKDTKTDPIAFIDFTPTSTGWYKFIVKCYKFKDDYTSAHYGLLVLHK